MTTSRVFVSHSTSDKAIVCRLLDALAPYGVDLWIDRRELAPGDALDPEIAAAIDDAAHVIAILGPEALKSAWVKKEVERAKEVRARKPGFRLVPVLRPPLEPEMTSWLLGEDVVAIRLGDEPGAFDQAVAEILVALDLDLPEDSPEEGVRAEPRPLDDLVLELEEPEIREEEGKRRAAARARLVFRPAEPGARAVTSDPFRFVAPLGPIEVDDLTWYLERYAAWPSEHFQERARRVEAKLPKWGQMLHRAALTPEDSGDVFAAWAGSDGGSRRFSVLVNDASIDGDKKAAAKEAAQLLLSLPWELVHDGDDYLFRGASGVRVRRQLPNRKPVPTLVTEAPIRVLLVSPRPEDDSAAYIDHRISARPLVEALDPLGELVELRLLRPPTFPALRAELTRARRAGEPYDVVHFDGHGIYDKRYGLGALCFEDPNDAGKLEKRRTAIVQADDLAGVIRGHRVPLVFLEACQTAMADVDPTSSVAGRLLDRGVASVVAMSHSVLVETARRFVGAFYRSLMTGERVGEAMLDGQCELADDPKRGRGFAGDFHLQDWFVPVLYQEQLDPPLIVEVPGERVKRVVAKGRELSLGALPAVPDHGFIGRSRELLGLERLLEEQPYAVVLGEGGEGKTTLATELARWLVATRRFARAAFVSVENALDLRSLVFALGDQLMAGFAAAAGKDPEKAVPLIERALRERPTVVVLDNMESVLPPPEGSEIGQAQVFEPKLLEEILDFCQRLQDAGATRLVFTSREALPKPFDSERHRVRIGRLDRGDAVALVARVLGEEEERPRSGDAGESEDEVERLVDAVDRHARSLVLVTREVAASGVRRATDRLEELMAAMAKRHDDDRERSLYASVELSLRRLPETTRRRLPRLGVFQGGGHLGVIAQVLGLDVEKDEEVELARQLVSVGLGELLPYGHLRLHPALGPLLRSELEEAELEKARLAWMKAMAGLAEHLSQQQHQDAQLAATLAVLELPNLLGALELLKARAAAEEVLGVATRIEGLFQYVGRSRAMARVVRIRHSVAKGLGKWTHGRFLAESAGVDRLLEAGRFVEAVQMARAVLQKAAAGAGAYELAAYDLSIAHFRLGRALRMGGAAEAALRPLAEARERFQSLGNAGDRAAARMAMRSVGETGDCLSALGRLDEAAAAYEEEIREAEEADDPREVAVASGQLGTVRMEQRRYEEALTAHNEARKTFEQLGEPRSVATAWHQIGRVYEEAGQDEAAEHAYQRSLKIEVLSGDRSFEAATLNQLGSLYRKVGRFEDAVRFHRQSAEIRVELGDLMKEGYARNNVADALIQLERYDEAREEILRAIKYKKPYGHAAQQWKSFDILHNIERAAGDAAAAARARDDAVAAFLAYRRAGGENHGPGGRLVILVHQAVTGGETAAVRSQLAELGAGPDLPAWAQALIPVLEQILDGSRDTSLASTQGLDYDDAVEVQLLLERLSEPAST